MWFRSRYEPSSFSTERRDRLGSLLSGGVAVSCYDFETRLVSGVAAIGASKPHKLGGEVMPGVLSPNVDSLNVTLLDCIEAYRLEWKRLDGKIDREEVPDDDGISESVSLEQLLQCNAS